VTNTQLTLIQIDNYGPWTVTPEPRREVDLQTLQSRLYADISQLIGNREGYVFFGRFDNMVAVTNGLDRSDLALIQEAIGNRYPVTASLSTAVDSSSVAALGRASERLQDAGSAQVDVELKVGVGRDQVAQAAGMAAKHALETCRENGSAVEFEEANTGDRPE